MADDRFFLVDANGVVTNAVRGRVTEPGFTTVPVPAGSSAWIGWTYAGGVFSPPVVDAAIEVPLSDADRIAEIERRLAEITPPETLS